MSEHIYAQRVSFTRCHCRPILLTDLAQTGCKRWIMRTLPSSGMESSTLFTRHLLYCCQQLPSQFLALMQRVWQFSRCKHHALIRAPRYYANKICVLTNTSTVFESKITSWKCAGLSGSFHHSRNLGLYRQQFPWGLRHIYPIIAADSPN